MLDLLPDLFDHYPSKLQLLPLAFKPFGGKPLFWGEIVTVKCFEDNSKVKEVLAQNGQGKVLVVDGGGSCRQALLGDLIAQSALDNGWQGVIINGFVRDVMRIKTFNLGVYALGAIPIKTEKRDQGEINVPVDLGGVMVKPGMQLYADENGIAVSDELLNFAFLS
ncbi:putative 4-hydroxy-4-methyl-2-oxoglutarate aldolase [Shewanella glacialipiscicola]|uniref:putative 4-hydroxy-4-methyl-2-oxoglutarate aldolase n=1 Tax=Shewanella glacialipiscicola TaxID=614069 RepID=UPI001BBAC3BD|nr:putative 4-hydroxy-4-methyl-2-oxoglutarate aldolase [Shewanella glacialipiscicola]MCL1084704.1 putative 4-hydroxy-4-methyl-2-oxoglutarate aldolase [Shewanella glacialipiscicola]MCU7995224.1 putative 4-hydroxy-4-methyl-2-oxoglutarate aldolase [Shewanella glacialipiscicola]MCU8026567.1 putative 4-hydroxy-4-methyl-2-oxoglutarate aldolase [Shewanella glacialipiscicola]GIU15785.1 putative 4-hydroxy-4-methyl-2-oxoglutarate aldolase [Shewanella glacialipiscicola]